MAQDYSVEDAGKDMAAAFAPDADEKLQDSEGSQEEEAAETPAEEAGEGAPLEETEEYKFLVQAGVDPLQVLQGAVAQLQAQQGAAPQGGQISPEDQQAMQQYLAQVGG